MLTPDERNKLHSLKEIRDQHLPMSDNDLNEYTDLLQRSLNSGLIESKVPKLDIHSTIIAAQELIEARGIAYGKFSSAMIKTANVFNAMTDHSISPKDVALLYGLNKLIREQELHKNDNIIDAVNYIAIMNEL